jgi:hypothetical protein
MIIKKTTKVKATREVIGHSKGSGVCESNQNYRGSNYLLIEGIHIQFISRGSASHPAMERVAQQTNKM